DSRRRRWPLLRCRPLPRGGRQPVRLRGDHRRADRRDPGPSRPRPKGAPGSPRAPCGAARRTPGCPK
ncbi:unnamed protein product, partial [Prorocentrum cordatum]